MKNKTICLNMIVKNERDVILRCLASVKPLIQYWVIVDTGSTDGTQEIIREYLKEIPGELHERPWVNFASNRNEALLLAKDKADYHLFIDADDELIFLNGFKLPPLDKDCYLVNFYHGGCETHRVLISRNSPDWKWEGVVHENLNCSKKSQAVFFKDLIYMAHNDGCRSSNAREKYLRDAETLQQALLTEPDNGHYVFQMALAYEASEMNELARDAFKKRVTMGGFEPEVWYSLYRIAALEEKTGAAPEIFIDSYLKAYFYRPSRAEPLFAVVNFYVQSKQYYLGYLLAKIGLSIPIPTSTESFWTERMVYEYGLLYLFSQCAYFTKKYQESLDAFKKLLHVPTLPQNLRDLLQQNLVTWQTRPDCPF